MKILELNNLYREEGYIYYMRKFTGNVLIQIPGNTLSSPVTFTIETNPFGQKTIEIEIGSALNYPVLPIKKALTDYILDEDKEGRLP